MVQNIGNRAGSWRFAISLLVLTIVLLTASPIATIAQGEGLATSETTSEAQAPEPAEQVVPVVEQPTAVPVQPTAVPPTAVPPTEVPPTAVPPTIVPPTEVPPTAVPTEQVWVNTDALRVTDGVTAHTVQQGASATVAITYTVTTPRTSTTLYARLSGASDGWTISSPQLPDTDPAATTAAWTEAATLQPGTAFTLPIVITAPATVAQDHTVSLHLWSVVEGEKGQETGVAKTDLRIATITALAPPPTPTPTIEPTSALTAVPSPTAVVTRSIAPMNSTQEPNTCIAVDAEHDEEGVVVIEAAGEAKFHCIFSKGPGKVWWGASDLSTGWKVSTTGAPDTYSALPPTSASGNESAYDIYLKPDSGTTGIGTLALKIVSPSDKPIMNATLTVKVKEVPVTPTKEDLELKCEPAPVSLNRVEASVVTCGVSTKQHVPAGMEVRITELRLGVPQGVELSWNGGVAANSPHIVVPQNATISHGNPYTFEIGLRQVGCSAVNANVQISTRFAFQEGDPQEGPMGSVGVTAPSISLPPTVDLAAELVDFGTLTWNGEEQSYGAATQSTTLTLTRDPGCGGSRSFDIQVSTSTTVPGLLPEYVGGTVTSGSDITAPEGTSSLTVGSGFNNQGTVSLEFKLEPENTVEPKTYNNGEMTIKVTVIDAP